MESGADRDGDRLLQRASLPGWAGDRADNPPAESAFLAGAANTPNAKGGLSGRRLRQLIGFIEDNLGSNLSLETIAQAVGLSASHCKTAFRASLGQPIHQYVIQRRIERARTLLCEGKQSISQIALETGFAHQSHLAFHMRRVLGVSPGSLVREKHRK
jgi:AraC family transcriptional regulator